jgi:hypothetical protein
MCIYPNYALSSVVTYWTSISWAKEGKSKSLKTTIPREIADLINLSPNVKLGWEYDTERRTVTLTHKPKGK